jgi:hypothetical protein
VCLTCYLKLKKCPNCDSQYDDGKIYYKSGELKYDGETYLGVPNGRGKFYTRSGNKYYEGLVEDGKAVEGVCYVLGKPVYDGQVKNEMYIYGEGEGKCYKNGKLRYEGCLVGGKYHGKGKLYHKNGEVKFEGYFVKGSSRQY